MTVDEARKFLAAMVPPQSHLAPYKSVADFVLQEGQELKVAELPLRGCMLGEMKQCFKNSHDLILREPDLTYVEGYAFLPPCRGYGHSFPIHHAWCITPEGIVLDPTWKDKGEIYFGVPFDRDFANWFIIEYKRYCLIDSWEEGFPLLTGQLPEWRSKDFPKEASCETTQ